MGKERTKIPCPKCGATSGFTEHGNTSYIVPINAYGESSEPEYDAGLNMEWIRCADPDCGEKVDVDRLLEA